MQNADVLMEAGYLSAKDLIAIMLDLEKARHTDPGQGDQMPGDQLAEWLNEKEEAVQ